MSSPDQYPQLPPGVAPLVAGIASEFAAIRHNVEEAVRHLPPVVNFPPFPPFPVPDTNFVRPETASAAGASIAAGWGNYGAGYQGFSYQQLGTRVFLRGLLSPTAAAVPASGSGSVNNIAFLPAGVRPAAKEMFAVIGGDPSAIGRLDVLSDGTCQLSGIALPLGGYVTLSGVTFSTIAL